MTTLTSIITTWVHAGSHAQKCIKHNIQLNIHTGMYIHNTRIHTYNIILRIHTHIHTYILHTHVLTHTYLHTY